MRQEDVQIGATYRTKVGDRLATVNVVRSVYALSGSRRRFHCVTLDTRREIYRTAAKLRPMVEADKPAKSRELSLRSQRQYEDPDGIRTAVYIDNPQPVRGMISNVSNGPIVMVGAFDGFDRIVRTAVDRVHVAESWRVVAWAIRHRIREMYRPSSLPRALRRGLLYAAAKRHAANRNTYRMVMGEAPFPTEEMIGRAILGTQADRDRLLRHVDELQAG
jgi:hypothetical protein